MKLERFLKDSSRSARSVGEERAPEVGDEGTLEIRNRILSKIAIKLGNPGVGHSEPEPAFHLELMPDVIVIRDDQSLLFEAQNDRALAMLTQICGFPFETMTLSERIRVHPCRSRYIIDKLKDAGVTVSI